jgi:hypothetical protein
MHSVATNETSRFTFCTGAFWNGVVAPAGRIDGFKVRGMACGKKHCY